MTHRLQESSAMVAKHMSLDTSSEVRGSVILYKHLTTLCFNFLIDRMETTAVCLTWWL